MTNTTNKATTPSIALFTTYLKPFKLATSNHIKASKDSLIYGLLHYLNNQHLEDKQVYESIIASLKTTYGESYDANRGAILKTPRAIRKFYTNRLDALKSAYNENESIVNNFHAVSIILGDETAKSILDYKTSESKPLSKATTSEQPLTSREQPKAISSEITSDDLSFFLDIINQAKKSNTTFEKLQILLDSNGLILRRKQVSDVINAKKAA